MVANIRGYTPNYNFKLINFDTPRWHTLEYANWQMADTLFAQVGLQSIRGEWQNDTLYNVGERVFDIDTNEVFKCNVLHTSSATGTFIADRALFPTRWEVQSSGVPVYRDAWLPGTFYAKGDIIKIASYAYHLCTVSHTSSGSFVADAANWTLVFDATAAVTDAQTAATSAEGSATSAAASATAAADSATAAQVAEINWKGPWSAATAYDTHDAVSDAGTSYIARSANTNKQPSTNIGTFWDILAQKGTDGVGGGGGGDMLKANNLSDVANPATSLSNIGGLAKTGGTMTGLITLPVTAPAADSAIRRDYVDTAIASVPAPPSAATAAEYIANSAPTKMLTPGAVWSAAGLVTVTDAASVAPNLALGCDFFWSVGAAGRTLANATGGKAGQKGLIYLQFSSPATITTWGSNYKFPGGTKPTTTPTGVDILSYAVGGDGTTLWCSYLSDVK